MPAKARTQKLTPAEIVQRLSTLYGEPELRTHGDPMTELILTILSQNTSDGNSGRAFMRLISRFPAWEALREADPAEIEDAISIGGLAKVKTPRIKRVLEDVWAQRGSFDLAFLREMPLDEAKEWLRALPGVGPKTAACVLMFALGRPALPVDTHVHRVAQRLRLLPPKATPEKSHDLLEAQLEPDEVYPFHISLIKHGRRICHAQRPKCDQCPLLDGCPFGRKVVGERKA